APRCGRASCRSPRDCHLPYVAGPGAWPRGRRSGRSLLPQLAKPLAVARGSALMALPCRLIDRLPLPWLPPALELLEVDAALGAELPEPVHEPDQVRDRVVVLVDRCFGRVVALGHLGARPVLPLVLRHLARTVDDGLVEEERRRNARGAVSQLGQGRL